MKKSVGVLLILFLLLPTGCKHLSDSVPPGAFAFTSYDTSGTTVAKGWMSITAPDSSTISGEWHFDAIGEPARIGPQIGDGKLVGGLNGQKIWIELHPEVRNNNLQLNGVLSGDRLSGQWTWISNEGMANQGTFQAIRK